MTPEQGPIRIDLTASAAASARLHRRIVPVLLGMGLVFLVLWVGAAHGRIVSAAQAFDMDIGTSNWGKVASDLGELVLVPALALFFFALSGTVFLRRTAVAMQLDGRGVRVQFQRPVKDWEGLWADPKFDLRVVDSSAFDSAVAQYAITVTVPGRPKIDMSLSDFELLKATAVSHGLVVDKDRPRPFGPSGQTVVLHHPRSEN